MLVYKVLTLDEAAEFDQAGEAPLSPADARDGYVHLSTRAQLLGTMSRHFAGERAVRVLGADPGRLGEALRWEPGRDGDLFPHLYGRLQAGHVVSGWLMGRGHDSGFRLPVEMPA
ncbi:MAG TPA: DUF952 domain-containing protein [Paracoccaceae bacterium]|nr:DUF952 domain-containing protein [Paracoccaceae bacterium]